MTSEPEQAMMANLEVNDDDISVTSSEHWEGQQTE
jgi:hypothetical protein